jgi:mannose-6-phosphate isomerase-like protein (cupin superfamily)
VVVDHGTLRHFANNGNDLVGVATPSLGSREHEVWRSSIAVGSHTPLHRHESEEIFVFLRGKGRAEIGGHAVEFSAPATVIAPAGVPHQFFNTGSEPTDAIVVVRLGSTIEDAQGTPMQLPWRR